MEIEINYLDRKFNFVVINAKKKVRGDSIQALLACVEKSPMKIKSISLSGQTKSYTFVRQIYLLINMLKSLSQANLFIDGRKINKPAFPDYAA